MATYIQSINFTTYFTSKLANTGALDAEATEIGGRKTTIDTTYTNTEAAWSALGAAVVMPDQDLLTGALATNCEGFSKASGAALDGVKDALSTFSQAVVSFKSATHDPLIGDVAAFNSLPAYEYSARERTEAEQAGTPISADPTRTAAARWTLVGEIVAAETAYQMLVSNCVNGISTAAPQTPGKMDAKSITDALGHIKKGWDFAKTWVDRGGDLVNFGGKLAYVWKSDAPSVSKVVLGLLPGWVSQFPKVKEMAGKWFRPTSGPFNYAKFYVPRYGDTYIPKHAQSYWAGIDWKYTTTTTKDGVMSWNGLAVSGIDTPAWMTSFMGKAEKAQEWMKKVGDSKAFKFADRALVVVDAGMTYYDKYQSAYNDALKEGVSPADAKSEALWTAGIEGTSTTVGKVAGGYIGRVGGAAIGQALIPIPGVGAAVGGFVGGFVGEKVGGFIGEKVGGFINDARKNGVGEAWNNVVDDTKKAFSDAGTALSTTAKAVGDGVVDFGKKLLGWKW